MKKIQKGFTLIELLVVIAIIGILASIALTQLTGATQKAKEKSALASARSVMPELVLCMDDAGNMQAPTNTTTGGGVICSASGHTPTWPTLSGTGFTYTVTAGAVTSSTTFTVTSVSPAKTYTCSVSTASCS